MDNEPVPMQASAESRERSEVLEREALKLMGGVLDALDTFLTLEHDVGVDNSSAVDRFTEIRDRLEGAGFEMIVVEPRREGDFDQKRLKEGEHKGVMVRLRANNGDLVNIAFYGGFFDTEDAMRPAANIGAIYDRGAHARVDEIGSEPTIYNLNIRSGEEAPLNFTMEIKMNAAARVIQMTVGGKRSTNNLVLPSSDQRYADTAGKMHNAAAVLSRMVESV